MADRPNEETPGIFGGKVLYREWGYYFAKQEQYGRATTYFKKSTNYSNIDDVRTLFGLCRAQIYSASHPEAANIAEECLHISPYSYQTIRMRIETLFMLCEFDYSLLYAYRGMRIQKLPFKWDIYEGNEIIDDCVGQNTSPKTLQYLLPYIRELQKHRKVLVDKLNEGEDELQGIDEDESRFKDNDSTFQREVALSALNNIFARTYLSALFGEKNFMNRVMEFADAIASPNRKTTSELHKLFFSNYQMIMYHQNLLRVRRPFYRNLLKRFMISKGHKAMIEKEKLLRTYNIIIEADFLLRKLHTARMCKDYFNFFRNVDRIKDKFASYPKRIFPLKRKCLSILYKMIAWIYIDARNLACVYCEKDKGTYLKHHLGIHASLLPRDNDMAWERKANKRTAFREFRRKLAMASQSLELAWLFHEFCKFLIEIHRFDLARFYAKKARDMGYKAKCDYWVLNANHLIIRIEFGQNNRNEARDATLVALAGARKLGIEHLVDFYTKSLEFADEVDIERIDSSYGITARQQLIFNLMPESMRTTVDFLWKNMEAVPAKRRISVMPGCKPVDRKLYLNSRRRTILSDSPTSPERQVMQVLLKPYAFSPKRPGFINFT